MSTLSKKQGSFRSQCFILRSILQYVVSLSLLYLMTGLDNSDANEQLKFSILKRLPEVTFLLDSSLEIFAL